MQRNHFQPIALVGLIGAGKSVVTGILAHRLGVPAVDLDAAIEAEAGRTIAELFASEGEERFRDREERMLRQVLDDGAGLVACGGGVVLRAANRAVLRERCRTVWLEVPPAEAARRVAPSRELRPVIGGGALSERLAELLETRAPGYAEVARVRIDTAGREVDQVVEAILEAVDRTKS